MPLKAPGMSNPQIPQAQSKPQPSSPKPAEKAETEKEISLDPDLEAELQGGTELEKAIYRMHKNGLTSYDTIETYRAKDPLTREEAAKIITQAYIKLGYPQENKNPNCDFSDKEKFNPSLASFVAKSCQYAIFKGAN